MQFCFSDGISSNFKKSFLSFIRSSVRR